MYSLEKDLTAERERAKGLVKALEKIYRPGLPLTGDLKYAEVVEHAAYLRALEIARDALAAYREGK